MGRERRKAIRKCVVERDKYKEKRKRRKIIRKRQRRKGIKRREREREKKVSEE